jgi:hypothetical protein
LKNQYSPDNFNNKPMGVFWYEMALKGNQTLQNWLKTSYLSRKFAGKALIMKAFNRKRPLTRHSGRFLASFHRGITLRERNHHRLKPPEKADSFKINQRYS